MHLILGMMHTTATKSVSKYNSSMPYYLHNFSLPDDDYLEQKHIGE